MLKVLRGQSDSFLLRFLKLFCGCCCSKTGKWIFERAPEPDDIQWENLEVSTCMRICNNFGSYFVSIIVIGLSNALIFYIKLQQSAIKERLQKELSEKLDKDVSLTDQAMLKSIAGFSAALRFVINVSFKYFMKSLSTAEQHETVTKMNVSMAFKLLVARFINSSLIMMAINNDPETWFKSGGLAYEATIFIGIMTFQTPVVNTLNIDKIKKSLKKCI